jgi:hypothetical protein
LMNMGSATAKVDRLAFWAISPVYSKCTTLRPVRT